MGQHIWGNTYATSVNCLVLLQKKCVQLLCGATRLDHTSRLFFIIIFSNARYS